MNQDTTPKVTVGKFYYEMDLGDYTSDPIEYIENLTDADVESGLERSICVSTYDKCIFMIPVDSVSTHEKREHGCKMIIPRRVNLSHCTTIKAAFEYEIKESMEIAAKYTAIADRVGRYLAEHKTAESLSKSTNQGETK